MTASSGSLTGAGRRRLVYMAGTGQSCAGAGGATSAQLDSTADISARRRGPIFSGGWAERFISVTGAQELEGRPGAGRGVFGQGQELGFSKRLRLIETFLAALVELHELACPLRLGLHPQANQDVAHSGVAEPRLKTSTAVPLGSLVLTAVELHTARSDGRLSPNRWPAVTLNLASSLLKRIGSSKCIGLLSASDSLLEKCMTERSLACACRFSTSASLPASLVTRSGWKRLAIWLASSALLAPFAGSADAKSRLTSCL